MAKTFPIGCALLVALSAGLTAQVARAEFRVGPVEVYREAGGHREAFAAVAAQAHFQEMSPDTKFRYTQAGVWIRFTVINAGTSGDGYLVFDDSTPNLVELYTAGMAEAAPRRGGSFVPLAERDVVARAPSFRLSIPAGASRMLYARFETYNIVSPAFHFESDRSYVERTGFDGLVLGVYYGAAIALLLYNLFLFLTIRDRNYLLYSFWLLGTAGTFFIFDGFADLYLSWITTGWQRYTTGMGMLGLLGAAIFSHQFLDIPRTAPRFNHLMRAIIAVNAIGSVFGFTSYTVAAGYFVDTMTAVTATTVMTAGFLARFAGFRAARFYVLSWIVLFATGLAWLLGMHGVLPRNELTTHGILLGSGLEMLLMSIALGDRMKLIQNAAREQEGIARAARMIAHDVRKPFSQIDAILTALAREAESGSVAGLRAFAARRGADVRETMRYVDGLLEEIMGLGRRERPAIAKVDARQLVEAALRTSGAFGPAVKIEVNFTHRQAVAADAVKMQRVLLNLLDNARAALGERGGRLWIRASDVGGRRVRLVIGNDGPPIAAGDLARIFEPFFTKGKARGTGLGLAVCLEIVAAHGGLLSASSAEGGTEFTLELPACGPLQAPGIATEAVRTGGYAASVPVLAIVDDDPFIRDVWQLDVRDAEVTTFSTPAEFDTKWRNDAGWRGRLAAVVTDLDFGNGGPDGVAFARQLIANGLAPAVPVLLASDWTGLAPDELAVFTARIPKSPASLAELRAQR